jgi:hypothetical protein
MSLTKTIIKIGAVTGLLMSLSAPVTAGDHSMSFFVTSVGVGDGANLAGLAGGDAHCQKLAAAAGSKRTSWRAYLSTQVAGGRGISARDRIGQGPWYNANGELIASDVDQLHILPNLVKRTAVDENGKQLNGRGDKPNRHDILTGSKADGTAYFPWEKGDKTCSNWTSNDKGSATVGHHDRHGGGNTSWNTAHSSRGCSQANLKSTGGAGLLYCFAAD